MGFYYISVFSLMLLGAMYVVLLFVFWGIARLTRGVPGRKALLTIVGVVLLLLPISEELWIAWNFGQACKEAGTFIYKKVQVDGFYDDTRSTHAGEPTQQAAESFDKSGYRFLEMKGPSSGVVHIQKVDGRWKSTLLDRATARYWFKWNQGAEIVTHKVGKTEYLVVDITNGETIARYKAFGRDAPWFFIGLDRPPFACDVPGGWPYARGNLLVYRDALIPAGSK